MARYAPMSCNRSALNCNYHSDVDVVIGGLVARARQHEPEAFAELLTLSLPLARGVCARLSLDAAEIDDVLQEACLQAWLGLTELQRPERFRQWLAGIALNLARMRLRAQRPSLPLEPALAAELYQEPVEAAVEANELRRAVEGALSDLPGAIRETIAAHYLDGRSLPEISARTGTPIGTLKARLHRGRLSLRDALGAPDAVSQEKPTLIEVVVHSVLTFEPTTDPLTQSRVLILGDRSSARLLPIWIGKADGDFLAFQLSGQTPPRPLTLNLLAQVLALTQTTLQQVTINRLIDEVFYATLHLTVAGQPQALDARPSDAVNLALLKGVPIFVATEILDSQAKTPADLHAHLTQTARFADPTAISWVPVAPPDWPTAKP